MGMEKQGSKGGGFLQLFDWNKKSRKKLFSSSSEFPEGSKQAKRSSNLSATRPYLTDDEDNGRSSIKGSSDYSCSSSVTDEEGNAIKAPGVVARLMGLDSLPTSSVVEPFSTPYFDSRSLRDVQYKRTPDFLYERQFMHSGKQPTKLDGFSRNPLEVRPQKTMNRPIERFQTEMLPPKSAKSISVTHNKLFSPIKSPGYIPTKNAAQIMEEAAKIIEPGQVTSSKGKLPLVSSSVPLKLRDLTEKMEVVQRPSRLPEASQRPTESRAYKQLKGQSLSKSWNGVEEPSQFKGYQSEENKSSGSKNKGKSISLAVQAKVNVQKRGGLSSSTNPSSQGKKEHKELKSTQQLKNHQPNAQKNTQKKATIPSPSGVLRQNNQKQNCSTNRDRLSSKQVLPNKQGRKASQESSFIQNNKPLSKVATNTQVGPQSRVKNLPRKKRAIEEDAALVNKDERLVQSNVAIEGHSKWMDDSRRKGMDVVSFTFTSPMKKHATGSQSSTLVVEKHANFDLGPSENNLTKLSSLGLNVIGGDALNILLEQKLRELTNGLDSSSCNSAKSMNVSSSGSTQSSSVSDRNSSSTTSIEWDKRSQCGVLHNSKSVYDSNCFSTEAHVLQGEEGLDERSVESKARKEFNFRNPSPISILEPCFSNDSCISSDSADSNSINDSSQSQQADSSSSTDSATSTCTGNFTREEQELEFIQQVMNKAESNYKEVALGKRDKMVNPSLLPKNLEISKVMYDCVGECLDLRCKPCVTTGWKNWVKGEEMVRRKEWLVRDIWKEISGLRNMGDWMLDELVEKDMGSGIGKWLDFEMEEFELGEEIGERILSLLVDEVVCEIMLV